MSEFRFQDYADKQLPGAIIVKSIHNWFVAVWAEMGIFGLIVFCWLNFGLMVESFIRFRQSGFVKGKYFVFTFTALLVLMIDALVLPNYDYENIYWIIVAIGLIALKEKRRPASILQTTLAKSGVPD
jgi:O-antigen ligase